MYTNTNLSTCKVSMASYSLVIPYVTAYTLLCLNACPCTLQYSVPPQNLLIPSMALSLNERRQLASIEFNANKTFQ